MNNKFLLYTFFLITINVILFSCVNPTLGIEADINLFKKTYHTQIQTIQASHRIIGYAWSGNNTKRPIVFVHGSPGSWEGWSHFLLDSELQKKFHLIAVDRPGFGGSEFGTVENSIAQQAENILEVLKTNNSHLPAILVGHSMGGPIIARAAMDNPGIVSGLVFVASSVSPDQEKTKWFQYPASWWPIKYLIPTELRVCNEEILTLKDELIKMLPLWKNISAKVAIVHGEADDMVPIANVNFLVENLKQDQIVKVMRIPDLNHFVPWKRPELIIESIQLVNNAVK